MNLHPNLLGHLHPTWNTYTLVLTVNRPVHTLHKYTGLLNGGDYCALSYLSHG